MESASAEVSVNQEQNSKDVRDGSPDNYDYVYCTICYNDQPLRAKHCKQCGTCIATFDHHCPFIDNCIGEKNKLMFFWFIFFQCLECILTCALLITSIQQESDWSEFWKLNYKYIITAFFPFLLGILLAFLWSYHLYLACKGLTTFELLKWKDIHYLGTNKESPFNRGVLKNLIYYCKPCKNISLWRVK